MSAITVPVAHPGHKTCSRCQEDKPLFEFHKGKAYQGGRRGVCKRCSHQQSYARQLTRLTGPEVRHD